MIQYRRPANNAWFMQGFVPVMSDGTFVKKAYEFCFCNLHYWKEIESWGRKGNKHRDKGGMLFKQST